MLPGLNKKLMTIEDISVAGKVKAAFHIISPFQPLSTTPFLTNG